MRDEGFEMREEPPLAPPKEGELDELLHSSSWMRDEGSGMRDCLSSKLCSLLERGRQRGMDT